MSTAWIPQNLIVILDYIVERDPELKDRSSVMLKATWEWLKKHPLSADYMKDTTRKFGTESDVAPAEDDVTIGTTHAENLAKGSS